jgi:hypothetical protein
MFRRPTTNWLAVVLWWSTAAVSAGLLLLVVLSPVIVSRLSEGSEPRRIMTLFARDAVVRRTALASALGLMVTASVFFRAGRPRNPQTRAPNERSQSAGVAGA